MSANLDLFDSPPVQRRSDEGRVRKAAGQRRALEGRAWKQIAIGAFERFLAQAPPEFVVEEFRQWWSSRADYLAPRSPNAWGALTSALTKSRRIEPTTHYRQAVSPKTHAHPVRVWRRA